MFYYFYSSNRGEIDYTIGLIALAMIIGGTTLATITSALTAYVPRVFSCICHFGLDSWYEVNRIVPFFASWAKPALSSGSWWMLTSGTAPTEAIAGSISFRCVPNLDFFLICVSEGSNGI
jgi:hypothetical protein